jgi:hypothetical protein
MEHSINCTNQRPPPTPHRVEPDIVGKAHALLEMLSVSADTEEK